MNGKVLLAIVLVAAASCSASSSLDDEWAEWRARHGKEYGAESVRRVVWESNWRFVQEHNSCPHVSYEVEMNLFADLTAEEFSKVYLSKINMATRVEGGSDFPLTSWDDLPKEMDWRTKGIVTGVKNQGQCGSCWAFSTTGSLEGQHALKTGKLVSLSEQQLVDCSGREGNMGCNGGLMDEAFKYIKINGGLDTESCYSYQAHDERCRYKTSCEAATDTGFVDVPHDNETALLMAVGTVGPISVAIDASHRSFQLYKRGVYNEPECSSVKLDHGVLAIGYGVSEGEDYWLVKNSWGTVWGTQGYIMMSRNKNNQCGIASQASYPLV